MIRGPVVIDASVVVEMVVDLGKAELASKLFERVADQDIELWVPDLIFAESLSALRRLVRLEHVRSEDADRAVRSIGKLPIQTTGTEDLIPQIWRLRQAMTCYDAAYVALASRLRTTLITADDKLARSCRDHKRRAATLAEFD